MCALMSRHARRPIVSALSPTPAPTMPRCAKRSRRCSRRTTTLVMCSSASRPRIPRWSAPASRRPQLISRRDGGSVPSKSSRLSARADAGGRVQARQGLIALVLSPSPSHRAVRGPRRLHRQLAGRSHGRQPRDLRRGQPRAARGGLHQRPAAGLRRLISARYIRGGNASSRTERHGFGGPN